MIRLTVIYGRPADPAAFDSHYTNVHCKLVRQMPNLAHFAYSRGPVISSDTVKPIHLVAYLDYDSKADLDASLSSEEGKAAVDDVANFADGGVTILTTEI